MNNSNGLLVEMRNFINGKFTTAKSTIQSINPATGKPHATIPDSSVDEINLAVSSAKAAFPIWSKTTRKYRSGIMHKIADAIEARLDEFATAESIDQGKPYKLALSVDIPRAIYNFRFFANYILNIESSSTQLDGIALNYIQKVPAGVAGLISPWNLPLYLLTWKIAPAIAYGCTCVCKPSEFTSYTAYLLCTVFESVKLPDGIVNIVFGTGLKAGEPLVSHPDVNLISFTGGTVTGSRINELCAKKFKKVSLELGGKNANIIFDDADLDKAVATSVKSSFSNQGEICLCGSRIFIHKSIYTSFLSKFIEQTKALTIGNPLTDVNLGALVSLQHLEKVISYVNLAREEGGIVESGGQRILMETGGYFYPPTIITGLKSTSRVSTEEIFGPVVVIHPFSSEEEAISMSNATEYGLSASVWTENGKRGRRVAQALDVGTVWINCWMVRDLLMPFGGTKKSGMGREGGKYSGSFFTEEKTVCIMD